MSKLPQALINSLQNIPGFNEPSFVQVHESGQQLTSVRFNPAKFPGHFSGLPVQGSIPWTSHGYYLSERPFFTFDPWLHAGVYYVQEASSMFIEQALRQTVDLSAPLRVLDLCAAPGGKSTLLQSLLSKESLLVSNDVIKSRAAILEENMVKWGAPNVIITNNDPADFARLPGFFDVILVDAPCSGSGLFRRDPEAIGEWSLHNVQLCYQRQQRILADVYPALKQGGLLIYSTCSYSKEEDEAIGDWLSEYGNVSSVPLQTEAAWGITEVQSDRHKNASYRFFPDKVAGEGFFMSCFLKNDGEEAVLKAPKKLKLQKATKDEIHNVQPWLVADSRTQLWKQEDRILALPEVLGPALLMAADQLYLRQAGITVGKMAGKELIPDHALAVSTLVNPEIVALSLKKEEALQYLRKEEVVATISHKGWALVRYEGTALGWVKILANRTNNYYPKEWRILKSAGN